jgi:hypothetical protein
MDTRGSHHILPPFLLLLLLLLLLRKAHLLEAQVLLLP